MNFETLINSLIDNTVQLSLPAFAPELVLCGTIVVMLLVRVFPFGHRVNAAYIALAGALIALAAAAPWANLAAADGGDPNLGNQIFTGMLIFDRLAVFFRSLLLVFAVLFVVFTQLSGIPDREDGPDFYTLFLGSTLGMCLMASANHLLIVFLAVEMASVPSYVLAGMLKGRRQGSEAAIKYSVYGAGAAGVMLYGISLLAGVLGTVHIPTMAMQLADLLASGQLGDRYLVLALGSLMVMVGLAFKLSAVPFHFWCPDVFEGASAEVAAFLSVSSKAAALALLVRVAMGIGYVKPADEIAVADTAVRLHAAAASADVGVAARSAVFADDDTPAGLVASRIEALAPARSYMASLVALFAAVTCTFGNLAAYGQTNIKRLLAYSTIAHAGYLMMPVAAAIQMAGTDPTGAEAAIARMSFYVAVYLFMNLGAFAVVAFLRNAMQSEEIADYAGLIRQCPGVVICLALLLISLLGVPPMAGFWAKLLIFGSLVQAKMWTLLAIGGANAVISLFYYLRVVKVMTLDPEPQGRGPVQLAFGSPAGTYVAVVTLPILVFGLYWDALYRWATAAATILLT